MNNIELVIDIEETTRNITNKETILFMEFENLRLVERSTRLVNGYLHISKFKCEIVFMSSSSFIIYSPIIPEIDELGYVIRDNWIIKIDGTTIHLYTNEAYLFGIEKRNFELLEKIDI